MNANLNSDLMTVANLEESWYLSSLSVLIT